MGQQKGQRSLRKAALYGAIFMAGFMTVIAGWFGKEVLMTMTVVLIAWAGGMSWRRLSWYRIVRRSRKIAVERQQKRQELLMFDRNRNGHN